MFGRLGDWWDAETCAHEQSNTGQRQLTIFVAEESLTECDEGTRVRLLAFQPRTPFYKLCSPAHHEEAWPARLLERPAHTPRPITAVLFQTTSTKRSTRETRSRHAMQPQPAVIDRSSLAHGQFLEDSASGNSDLCASRTHPPCRQPDNALLLGGKREVRRLHKAWHENGPRPAL